MPTAPTGPAVFAMAGASATSTVAEALRRFRAGEDVGPLPTPEPAPPARPPAATGTRERVVFTRPNGDPYYAREVPDAAHDVDLIRRCRGTTVHDSVFVLAFGDPGTGKGHPISTPILTPAGWTTIGALSVGDSVIGSNGKPTTVFGVFDRGMLPTYRITMSDGSSVEVDSTHLWRVQTKKGRWMTISTQEIIDGWDMYGRYNLAIPTMGEYDPAAADLPIPPYMLGALIADGSFGTSSIIWTKNDQGIADEMARQVEGSGFSLVEVTASSPVRRWRFCHEDDRGGYSVLSDRLKGLGLRGLKSDGKFIPAMYLTAPLEQRRALLAGLMDGDGSTTFGKKGQAVYHTISRRLAEDVRALMWSLGDSASIGRGKCQDGTWRVGLLTHRNPFLASKYAGSFRPSRTVWARRITGVVRVDDQEIRCIAVTADDHLYVAKDFIVTHNSSVFEVAFPDLITVTCNRDTMMDDLLGTWVQMPDGTYEWVYGPFAVAAMEGRPVLLDEVAVVPGSVLTDLHEAMDGRGRLRVKANPRLPVIDIAPGFWVGAACNPDAPGADMSDAWLSRFGVHIEYTTDYDLAVEAGVPRKFVEVALNLRAKREERKVRYVHQMRELLQAKADAERFGLTLAVRNFVGKAPVEDRPLVADVASRKFGFAVEPLRTGPAVSG